MRILRTDIQVLRAVAVLSVLVFHFDLPGLHKGFLGVDIFFVISGYLMSKVIVEEMDAGRFRAAAFYLRRARRLLPAALAMLGVVTLLAPFALTAHALQDYAWQLLGALGFSANLVLWSQSGYFDAQASLKPLLHTWSLAVEEQYYFLLPLLLRWLGARWRLIGLLIMLAASWLACRWWLDHDPSAAFYLLPSRAWELLIGSLCALPQVQARAARMPPWSGLCLLTMAWCLAQGVDPAHPGWDAMLICLSTAGLLLQPSSWLDANRAWMRPLHWIGDISYSLYLIHWPLIALAKNIWLEQVPMSVSIGLMLLSVMLADASYRFIEQRHRHAASLRALGRGLVVLCVPLLACTVWLGVQLHVDGQRNWAQSRQPVYGMAAICDMEADFVSLPACATTASPHTLVWGDSYAMHIVPALLASPPPGGLQQATRSACGPLLQMARQAPADPPRRGQQCLAFNRSVLRHLAQHPEITHVIIASRWQYYFDDPVVDAKGHPIHPDVQAIADAFGDVVNQLRALHKKVVLVSPPALLGPDTDLGHCGQRAAQGLITVAAALHEDCSFDRSRFEARQAVVRELLNRIHSNADIDVIWLDEFNCNALRCETQLNRTPIYRDFGHFSAEGARLLGVRLQLGSRAMQEAR